MKAEYEASISRDSRIQSLSSEIDSIFQNFKVEMDQFVQKLGESISLKAELGTFQESIRNKTHPSAQKIYEAFPNFNVYMGALDASSSGSREVCSR